MYILFRFMTTFQKLIGISALIIAIAIGYYFVIAIPNRDKLKQSLLQDQVDRRDECLQNAMNYYRTTWDRACEEEGLEANCILRNDLYSLGKNYNKTLQDQQEHCVKLYPSN